LGLLLKTTRTPFNTRAAFLLCFQRKRKENNNNNTTDSLLHIKRIAFSVSVGIILYIHTSSIERREKERLAKEKASSSSRSDFEEEEE